jgi:hypothetical protein
MNRSIRVVIAGQFICSHPARQRRVRSPAARFRRPSRSSNVTYQARRDLSWSSAPFLSGYPRLSTLTVSVDGLKTTAVA